MHGLRRLAAFLVLAPPLSLLVSAGVTWGAPGGSISRRAPHGFEASAGPHERTAPDRTESAVVLVVLDGVRWQEVFDGPDRAWIHQRTANSLGWGTARALMPNLHHLLDTQGVAIGAPGYGAEMVTGGPQRISLPSYRDIFTGKDDPACQSNHCARPLGRTVADDVFDSSGWRDVAVVASWPNIARAASVEPSRFVLTTGRRLVGQEDTLRDDHVIASLLDASRHSAPFPGQGDYRPDALTARIALRYLATARPRFMFIGLGDADEYGHRNDYRGYLKAMHEADEFLGELAVTLEAMGARGRHTTVILTTDHGRANDFRDHGMWHPESGRVWLVASGEDVRHRGLAASSRRHTLLDVAPTVRALLGMNVGDGEPISEIVGP